MDYKRLKHRIYQNVAGAPGASVEDLMQTLGITPTDAAFFQRALQKLEETGKIELYEEEGKTHARLPSVGRRGILGTANVIREIFGYVGGTLRHD